MITPAYAQQMARYNTWQNQNLFAAASKLSDTARKASTGAYFGSVHGTLAHLVWADTAWLFRFTKQERYSQAAATLAASAEAFRTWTDLLAARRALDADIEHWANGLTTDTLASNLTYSSTAFRRDYTRPLWLLVTHMFNHQTHHRGQVHCLLTQAGVTPDDTDLLLIWPDN